MFSKTEKSVSASRPKKWLNSKSIYSDDASVSQSPRADILLVPRLSPIDVTREPLTFVKPYGFVPTVLVNASKIIESHITERELFQIQGSMEKVEYLNHVLSRKRLTMPRNTRVHDVAEVVKVYLSRMSVEIIPEEIMTRLINIHQGGTYADYFRVVHKFHGLLPNVCPSVHFVLQLLNKVAQHADQNGMDARKLATIFVLDILKPLSQTEDNEDFKKNRLRRVQRLPYNIMAIEYLIQNVNIFEMALPVKDNFESGEKNNNWEPVSSKPREVESEIRPNKTEESLIIPDNKVTNYSTANRESRASIELKDKQNRTLGSRLSFRSISPQKPFTRTSSERGLSSRSFRRSKEKRNFSSLNIAKDQDNHNSSMEKADSTQVHNQLLHKTSELSSKRQFTYEENGSPCRSSKDKVELEKSSSHGLRETCRQPSKTKETSQRSKHPSSDFRKRIRSHSDSAKDMVEFKLPQRYKLTKRKSKEGKTKPTAPKLFKNDEELLPWGGAPTESDDVSLIVQSTHNPKTFQFLDKYHNMTGAQIADKVAVEPNVTPNPETHRKYRWNKNKCSSAKRKTSSNNIRTTSRSASTSRRAKKKFTHGNQRVEKGAAFDFNKVFPKETPTDNERAENNHQDDCSPNTKDESSKSKSPSPLKVEPCLQKTNKKIAKNYEAGDRKSTNPVGKRPPRPRFYLPKDNNDNNAQCGNILEWLCDIVLIIIAVVCAIYIYHLILI